jgi:primosomal protein N' (replication factor Y) (superfamily II helicase)
MPHYAEVAIPTGVDKTFTYLIPDPLVPVARAGVRVLVPFGKRTLVGIVVDLQTETSLEHVRPLTDVLDATPVVQEHLLKLCFWMAQYYMAPLGEILRAAMPATLGQTSKRRIRMLVGIDDPRLAEARKRSPKRGRVFDLLLAHGPMLATDLRKKTGLATIHGIIAELERDGIVATEEVVPGPRMKARIREYLNIREMDRSTIQQALDALPARQKKGRELLSALLACDPDQIPETDLLEFMNRLRASSATVKPFRESGLLPVVRREVTRQQDYGTEAQTLAITLNAAQEHVRSRIAGALDASDAQTFLLHGVTGSGKTQVYIECIRHCLALGRTAIVLVPEISLTPQIVRRFKSHFADKVLVVHSRMSAGERYDVWRLALSGECRVVIGPRSAVFAPLQNIGLIVVDEEHEASYKQYDAAPRYHARDVAIMRGRFSGGVVVLGSATPSVESFSNARAGKFELLQLPDRIDSAVMPGVYVVDMTLERKQVYTAAKEALPYEQRGKMKEFKHSSLSRMLQEKITDRLERKEGIILLQNRRGFAPFVECQECGHVEMCDNCNVSMTYHATKKHLRCHYCGLIRKPALLCPKCGGADMRMHGVGTQRVEEELQTLFPDARIVRMDLDTTARRGAHDRILRQFGDRQADILLGTQMVAKGLDFPHVTLVGVVSADTQMLLPDFRSSERTFQLLTQVAGRAGRSTLQGEVIVQTSQPGHRTLVHLIDHNYLAFFEEEIAERQELLYPPFSRLTLIETRGEDESEVQRTAERIAAALQRSTPSFQILGPAPAVIGKINKNFRWHIVLKTQKAVDPSGTRTSAIVRQTVEGIRTSARKTQIIVDIDPAGIM